MYILKFVLFICILDAECSGKSVTKVMACTGLKSFSIMHQRFDCVSSLCTGEFLFLCCGFVQQPLRYNLNIEFPYESQAWLKIPLKKRWKASPRCGFW